MGELTNAVMAIVYKSTDDGLTWSPVHKNDVPDCLKDPDQMAMLLAGNMAKKKGALDVDDDKLPWWRAEKIEVPTMDTEQ